MSISSEAAQAGYGAATPTAHYAPQAHGFAPGSVVADRYRIVSLLGRGGMGEVYGADDLKLGQRVALKFLPAERRKSSTWRDQFYAEVRMARQISHPNVCRMYDVGESDGRLFLSMEFVDGEDLASLLRRIGRLPDDKAVEVAQQLCAGLAAAHRTGVLHRDLKPSNVMLDGKGRARITDFGLAVAASEAGQTKPAGTPGYLAPELLSGAPPSVQSDLYALGLVLYELFTGKKAFDASTLGELQRKQTETDPTPPSSVVKNLDPAVERAILRCLDRDPGQRPRSALSVAVALPGGNPLEAALAAGETPSPEMVAAAGPQGSLRPAVAWACLAVSVTLILITSMFLAPRDTDWGLSPMPKSPEVLADRAQELAKKLGYPDVADRASWVQQESDYYSYALRHPSAKDWMRTTPQQVWPSLVGFWYRQSPDWMKPATVLYSQGPPNVGPRDPPYETAGMVAIKLDMRGNLLFLRAVPQVEGTIPPGAPDWGMLFAEAGLDSAQFAPASPKWLPPETFDSRADWEGRSADHPDLPLHVTAATYRGVPVYFQVITPWDKPWRQETPAQLGIGETISAVIWLLMILGMLFLGGLFARLNIRRGRADTNGAWRLIAFLVTFGFAYAALSYHFVPQSDYIATQVLMLGVPLLFATIASIGYLAVEPYARRMWPSLMVSWQRILSGRIRDPLVGRDILLGILVASVTGCVLIGVNGLLGLSEMFYVRSPYGQGLAPSVGISVVVPSEGCFYGLIYLAILSILTGLLRKRWLGLAATGIILSLQFSPSSALDLALAAVYVLVVLFVLIRIGLVATASFLVVWETLVSAPPLALNQWYAGRAAIALLLPLALLAYGFYVSLGRQPILGNALMEE